MRIFGANVTNKKLSNNQFCESSKQFLHTKRSNDELKQQHLQNLRHLKITCDIQISDKDKRNRQNMFKWILNSCKQTLQLQYTTIQHCFELFDIYTAKRGRFYRRSLEAQLYIITCLFISAKYNQIYPPMLTDFIYICSETFSIDEILYTQKVILKQMKFQLNLAKTSDWYGTIHNAFLPQWCYEFLALVDIYHDTQQIAEIVNKVQKLKFSQCKDCCKVTEAVTRIHKKQVLSLDRRKTTK